MAKEKIWIEDVYRGLQRLQQLDIFAILKREDEKYFTEKSYENPVFVEVWCAMQQKKLMC
jgi:GTP cyclohydrolase I